MFLAFIVLGLFLYLDYKDGASRQEMAETILAWLAGVIVGTIIYQAFIA